MKDEFRQQVTQLQGQLSLSSNGNAIEFYNYPNENEATLMPITLADLIPKFLEQDGILVEATINVNIRQIEKRTKPDFCRVEGG